MHSMKRNNNGFDIARGMVYGCFINASYNRWYIYDRLWCCLRSHGVSHFICTFCYSAGATENLKP